MKKTKLKEKLMTLGFIMTGILTPRISMAALAEEVEGGGAIASSKIAIGLMNMVKDLTGTMQWLLPTFGVAFILFYVFKIMTGDEQDQQRYKKAIIKVLVCVVVGLVAVTIINLIANYFSL